MPSLVKIAGGTLYDPANGIDGQVRDVWIDRDTGKIVAPPTDPGTKPDKTIDARGLVVMPGGVDMHCHIAGPKVNAARQMEPERRRLETLPRTESTHSGTLGSVPTTFATGYKYAGLGYTTAFDAAVAPLAARHAHLEFADTPCIDRGCFLLVGDHHFLLKAIEQSPHAPSEQVRTFLAWLLDAAKGYAPKLVNPGALERWKQGSNDIHTSLDETVAGFNLTARQIIQSVTQAANELRLPHPVHLHTLNLGIPGNWRTTLDTMQTLDGHRAHLAHIQFHSYGGGESEKVRFDSQVGPLVEFFNKHENLSVDVGQVVFGPTMSMTGDSAVGHYLARLYREKWYSCDVEMEAGCGVVPIHYKPGGMIHAWQWAIGLEWFLRAADPWRIALSTDHPNGGSFLAYPQIIHWLMNRDARTEALQKVHRSVRESSPLRELDREYTLGEICIITRAAPAKLLGLNQKGHLGPGADADITIYTPNADRDYRRMFELPTYVLKSGHLLIESGEFREPILGRTLYTSARHDDAPVANIRNWFNDHSTVRFANFPIEPTEADAALQTFVAQET